MLRRSASRAAACCLTTPAIRPVSTCSPARSSAVCEAAVSVCRDRPARVVHSVCQLPSGRSSRVVAAARCSCAACPGAARAARRISTESTGLAFCGIVEDPPRPSTAGSASSAISGRASRRTSLAMWPIASVARTSASAYRVRGARLVCQEGARSRCRIRAVSATRNSAASESPASSVDRCEGAGGAAELHREAQRAQVVTGVEDSLEPLRSLEPEGDRYGVLGERAAGHQVASVPLGQPGERGHLLVDRLEEPARWWHGRTGPTRCRARPGWSARGAASAPPPRPARPGVRAATRRAGRPGCRSPRRGRRSRPGPSRATRPAMASSAVSGAMPASWSARSHASSTRDHGLEEVALVERVQGPLVAGPEQVGHQSPKLRNTVSPSPCSRRSKTKPCSSRVATRVEPALLGHGRTAAGRRRAPSRRAAGRRG